MTIQEVVKVAICTPKRPYTLALHFSSLISAVASCRERLGFEFQFFQITGNALLEQARSIISTNAHEWGATVQVFIDDDVQIDAAGLELIVSDTLNTNTIVACPVPISGGSRFNVLMLDEKPFQPKRVVRAVDAGMGFTAIHRDVFQAIIDRGEIDPVLITEGVKAYPFFRSYLTEEMWFGEDTSFCKRALEAIGKDYFYADTRISAIHWQLKPERNPII